jgi:hypothetical protein
MDKVGSYNIYNIYDTCGSGNMSDASIDDTSTMDTPTVQRLLALFGDDHDDNHEASSRRSSASSDGASAADASLFSEHKARLESQLHVTGGPPYSWRCGMGRATNAWMNNEVVRKAIHVPDQEFYGGAWPARGMRYSTYTRTHARRGSAEEMSHLFGMFLILVVVWIATHRRLNRPVSFAFEEVQGACGPCAMHDLSICINIIL